MLSLLHKDYNGARAELMGQPLPAILLLLFVLVGIYHMELGMRSVIVDYIGGQPANGRWSPTPASRSLLGLACVYAVLRIGFV